jgi:hypothetical protein
MVDKYCYNHYNKQAIRLCEYCGKYICPDCITRVGNELYHDDCISIAFVKVPKKPKIDRRINKALLILTFGVGNIIYKYYIKYKLEKWYMKYGRI